MVYILAYKQRILDYVSTVAEFRAKTAKELTSVAAVVIFINTLTKSLAQKQRLVPYNRIWSLVVFAPIAEELLFRGLIQRGIKLSQKLFNWVIQSDILGQNLKKYFENQGDEENLERREQVIRIHLTALIFGLAHLTNSHASILSSIYQVSQCYFGGVAYGFLSEKYQTLTLPILAHATGNALVALMTVRLAKQKDLVLTQIALVALTVITITTLDVSCYLIGTDRVQLWNFKEMPGKIQERLTVIAIKVGLIKETKIKQAPI